MEKSLSSKKKQPVERECTAVVKTFERPNRVIQLVHSIRKYYPNLSVIVVDDSATELDRVWDDYTEYYHVGYDVGLSEGRNIAVRRVKTPYTLLLDDDYFFTKHTRIDIFLSILENHHLDLVAGNVIDHGNTSRFFRGTLHISDNKLYLLNKPKGKNTGPYQRFDFVLNFFLARTDLLRKSPWDPDLKIREHEEFFWRLKKMNARITYTNQVSVLHYPDFLDDQSETEYQKLRYGRMEHFHNLACQKIGVHDFVTGSNTYKELTGIFKLYSHWVVWIEENKSKQLLAKLSWFLWIGFRPLFKFIYRQLEKMY